VTADALKTISEAVAANDPSHVFALFSGGHDSLAATAVTAKHPRFTAAVHINTGIGIEETRTFVRDTCAERGWPLLEYGPPEHISGYVMGPEFTYEQIVMRWGFPGPPQHKIMYTRLKERALRALVRDHNINGHRVLLSTGIRWQESTRRMRNYAKTGKWHTHGRMLWVNPIADWSKSDCSALIEAEGLRRNRVVDLLHKSGECLCGAFSGADEMTELEVWFPEVAAYLHDLERRVEAEGRIGCVWGRRLDNVHRDQSRLFPILPLCQSCEAAA
jgi:3'-phosphoadenosine 5'-phosphosulfate sulfotransferase (PAPS reductase)/FAD synthetase